MDYGDKPDDFVYGECHCCTNKGYHKDLRREYFYNGMREVYSEIFMECFNITITSANTSRLICSSCINRLRDANSFREMVISADSRLRDPLLRGATEFAPVSELMITNIKTEIVKMEDDDMMDVVDNNGDTDDDDDKDITYSPDYETASSVSSEVEDSYKLVPGEAELLGRFALSALTLPRAAPSSFLKHCWNLRDKVITAKDVAKILEDTERMDRTENEAVYYTEKKGLIYNTAVILEYSNVTPFKSKTTHGFPCFFCRKAVDNLQTLRQHVNEQHPKTDIRKMLWKYGAECLIVNVDVTDLQCTLCHTSIPNLNELKKHLTQVHKKIMCTKFTDRVIPFKLDKNFECQMCGCNFETFGAVERHMNVHFRNYICKECGTGFATKYRLKVHIKSSHIDGSFPCSVCGKVFTSYQKQKTHIDAVHRMVKRFKCANCSERFTEYFARQKHMVDAHGAEPIRYKCNVCDRDFERRYNLSKHMKKDHLKEKDNECDVCGYKCFTVSELRVHMIKHVGERVHECNVCKKAYARKKTLKEHMKIHTNDRRHTCSVCGQAFIQKCSLKGHIKTHHPELAE